MSAKNLLKSVHRAMSERRWEDALFKLEKILSQDPTNIDALFQKARAHSRLREFNEAISLYDRILGIAEEESNRLANTLMYKGDVLLDLDRLKDAENCFDRAIQIEPELEEAWVQKALVAFKQKRYQKALQYIDRALFLDMTNRQAWCLKSHSLLRLNRLDESITCAKRAIFLYSDSPQAWLLLSYAYKKKGDLVNSESCFDEFMRCSRGEGIDE